MLLRQAPTCRPSWTRPASACSHARLARPRRIHCNSVGQDTSAGEQPDAGACPVDGRCDKRGGLSASDQVAATFGPGTVTTVHFASSVSQLPCTLHSIKRRRQQYPNLRKWPVHLFTTHSSSCCAPCLQRYMKACMGHGGLSRRTCWRCGATVLGSLLQQQVRTHASQCLIVICVRFSPALTCRCHGEANEKCPAARLHCHCSCLLQQ